MDLIPITNTVEFLIQENFSEEIQLAFLHAEVELQALLNMGLVQLREYVPDDAERLRLIKSILKYKRDELARGTIDSNASQSRSSSPSHSVKSHPSTPGSEFDPSVFLNEVNSDSSDSDIPLAQRGKKRKNSKDAENNLEDTVVNKESEKGPVEKGLTAAPSVPHRYQGILKQQKLEQFDLKAFLASNTTTAFILKGEKKGLLNAEQRKALLIALADYLINQTDRRPTQDDFLIVREKIYKLFPKELENLYYVAPKEHGAHQALARGKLFDLVRNKISKLIKAKAIEPLRKKNASSSNLGQENDQEVLITSQEEVAALLYLKRAREVTEEVTDKWKATIDHRIRLLYKPAQKGRKRKSNEPENIPNKVAQYFEDFKVLKSPKGYTLLLSDFKFIHKKDNEIFSSWPDFMKILEHLALESSVRDEQGKLLVEKLKSEDSHLLDENEKDAILIQLLPSLCPATAKVRIGKKTFKPSVPESRDAFVSYTTVGADVEPLIERRRDRMTKLNGPLQPYMVFQGPTRWNILGAYVICDRVMYKLDNALECLDTCFKLFHALNVGYPPEANHLWHILHLHLYKIKQVEGEVPMATQTFLSKLIDDHE